MTNNSTAMQVQNIFSPYYGGGYDESYLLDDYTPDYTRFPTMEEVLRKYVKGGRVKERKGH